MDPLRVLFWAGQDAFIRDVFMPILIGVGIFFPVLIVLFAFGFGRRLRLWLLGKPDVRSDNWATRLVSTVAVAIVQIRIVRPH